MKNRLSIYFRQKQFYLDNDPAKPVVVSCDPNGIGSYVAGTVPKPDWEDMTDHTEGLDKIKVSWSATQGDASESDIESTNEKGSNYQKGLSLELIFSEQAFAYIEEWLMMDVCQQINIVEVRIVDNDCGKAYRVFEIKLDNLKYSPEEEPCILKVPLREQDEAFHVFQKTIIEDNWQGWFNKDGTSTKEHPTFGMVVEKKPKFYLALYTAVIYIVGILSVGILTALNDGKRWIRRTLGFTYFCPSPLIRTYIENICGKYGFTSNTMFDDSPLNPYRDACLFWPSSSTYKNFDDFDSPSTKFIWDNRTVYPFAKFLNSLKKLFNAEWYVTPNNELVFQHISYFETQAPLYDFTAPGADKLYKLSYTFNGKKKPAYGEYMYMVDPQDTCSNEVKYRYNAIVDYDGPANNPILEGKVSKSFDFAMTAFHNDGSSEDFIREGVELGRLIAIGAIVLGLGQLLAATFPLTAIATAALLGVGYAITNGYVNNYFDNPELNGLVRVSSSEINMPRILLWDRTTPMNKAKVVYVVDPEKNPVYNLDNVDYYTEHPTYEAAGYFGDDVVNVWNYPMYVDELFKNNMYDRFHEHDNPLRNPTINQTWEGELDLCCEWLDRLGVWENDFARIGYVLTLENRNGRKIKGRIDYIQPDYDNGTINLNGTVLK